jgi:hypothetical protein
MALLGCIHLGLLASCRSYVERPHQPIRIAPLRLGLDDEGLSADHELIVRARVGDLARPQLEGRGLGVDAGLAEADDVSGRCAITRPEPARPPAGV